MNSTSISMHHKKHNLQKAKAQNTGLPLGCVGLGSEALLVCVFPQAD